MFPITVNVDLKSLYNDCPRLVTFLLEDPDLGRPLFKEILRDRIDSLTYDEPGDFNYELLVNVRFTNALPGGVWSSKCLGLTDQLLPQVYLSPILEER